MPNKADTKARMTEACPSWPKSIWECSNLKGKINPIEFGYRNKKAQRLEIVSFRIKKPDKKRSQANDLTSNI